MKQIRGASRRIFQSAAEACGLLLLASLEQMMGFLDKLFSRKTEPRTRVRICVECGMPIAEHKEWCSILRTQQELDRKGTNPPSDKR
jgi:hypothetical protein